MSLSSSYTSLSVCVCVCVSVELKVILILSAMPASAGCAGTSAAFNWGINSILAEFQRLKDHQGFPKGDQIDCPIFTQDKWNYIQALNDATDGITMPIYTRYLSHLTWIWLR